MDFGQNVVLVLVRKNVISCVPEITIYFHDAFFAELCPKPESSRVNLTKTSQVEDLPNPIPTLFQSLVSEPDTAERWFTLSFPVDYKVMGFMPELKKDPALNARKYIRLCKI